MKEQFFKLNTIRTNLVFLPTIFFLLLMLVLLFTSYKIFYNFLYKERIEKIKYVVDAVGVEFDNKQALVEKGEITRKQAEEDMIKIVSQVRFGHNDYIWLNDKNGVFIYHPNPALDKHNIKYLKDERGFPFGQKIYNIIQNNAEGFVSYYWAKPGKSSKQYPKVTYIKMHKGFGWGMASGIYIDDIQNKVLISILQSFIPIIIVSIVFFLFLRRMILEKIIIPLEKITGASQKIIEGQYYAPVIDEKNPLLEINNLTKSFKQFVMLAKKDKDNENKINTILNNISEGLLILDQNCIIESCNVVIEKMFEYSNEELIGEKASILISHKCQDENNYFLQNNCCIKSLLKSNQDSFGQTKNGRSFPLDILVNSIEFDGKKLSILVLRDITKEKELDKTKNEFISMVSHELRTPLTSIRGSLGLIISGALGAIPPKILELTTIANNNCVRLVNLINDILDIEKIKAGKMTFDIREYEIVSIVQETLNMNESYAKQYSINFDIKEKIDSAYVNIDRDRIIQVLTNLLSNATKFSKKNDTINIYIKRKLESILICIEDFGSGIPEEFRPKIFQNFSQADSSDARKKGGTGLGLAICKEIVEKLNGKISFDSIENVGTTFYLELPEIIKQNNPAMSALICDDSKTSTSYLKLFLEKLNYITDIAYSIEQAREYLAQNQYELMTLDLIFPDGNGLELLKEIRKTNMHRNLPVIIVSASEAQNAEEIEEYKIIKWINKSFNYNDLRETIGDLLKEKKESKFNILHVDDDPDIVEVTEAILKNVVNTSKASNIVEATEIINNAVFDLIILDYKLPDGNCKELIDKIRASQNQNAKILIFSAYEIEKELYKKVDKVFLKTIISSETFAQSVEELLKDNKT